MMDKVLRCQNCRWELTRICADQMLMQNFFRDNLDAEIWECQNGHGFCGDCVDKDNAGGGEGELKMGEDGIFR